MNTPTQLKATRFETLVTTLLDDRFADDAIRAFVAKSVMVIVGSLLIALAAQIAIPMYPVPMTAQTLAILLIGMTYGPRLAGGSIALYLFEGAMGLPVFANGAAGAFVLIGPTGGYLVGFLISAIVLGLLAERGMGRSIASTALAMLIGTAIIYTFGVAWLSVMIGLEKAFIHGMMPFLYGDVLKIIVAAGLMPVAWKAIKKLDVDAGDNS